MQLLEVVEKIHEKYKGLLRYVEVSEYSSDQKLKETIDSFVHSNRQKLIENRCHIISMTLAKEYPDKIKYVEGYTASRWLDTEIIIPIQHAWNKWGDLYFDLSAEIVSKVVFDKYILITEGYVDVLKNDSRHPLMNDEALFGYHLINRLNL